MPVIGFHASHEQIHPAVLLDAVLVAEQVGFTAAMCSDHFSPWTSGQGHSGFAWSWLGAAMQATELPFGVVNAPGQRYARLGECVEVIRALLAGEEVSHDGLVTVDRARIWTRPEISPKLIATAVSVETAAWAGSWADGLATITQPADHLRQMIEAYHSAGGARPLVCQGHLSYADTLGGARATAFEQWRPGVLGPPV